MAEEQEQQSGGTSIKQILIGLVSTITLGVGGWFTTKLTGGDEKEAAPVQQAAPVINIQNTQNQSQSAGGGSSIKNVIIGFISTITLGVGGWITTKLTGGDDKEAAPVQQAAPVINIQNNQTQQQAAGKTVIINKGGEAAKPAAPAPKPKKKDGDEFREKESAW